MVDVLDLIIDRVGDEVGVSTDMYEDGSPSTCLGGARAGLLWREGHLYSCPALPRTSA